MTSMMRGVIDARLDRHVKTRSFLLFHRLRLGALNELDTGYQIASRQMAYGRVVIVSVNQIIWCWRGKT